MTDYSYAGSSVPSSPVLPGKSMGFAHKGSDDVMRSKAVDDLREQLLAAKIPVSKRASVCEVPQPAADCQLIPGTTRCKLTLCEDECAESHQHHRTHAKALAPDAPLVYSRPSISRASVQPTPAESPADSLAPSTNTSPQQQYRRVSTFGFGLGSHRGSLVTSTLGDAFSGPPSPHSEASSAQSSAANSPRVHQHTAAPLSHEHVMPVIEESKAEVAASAMPAASSQPAAAAAAPAVDTRPAHLIALESAYWKLRNKIVNLRDYMPGSAGINTAESRARTDLAAAPRDDFFDQEHPDFDPRSPRPPSPVEVAPEQLGTLEGVNLNEVDPHRPELEYCIRPHQTHQQQ